MNLVFTLNNKQTCTVVEEKKEAFSTLLNQIARTQEEPITNFNITDLMLVVPELGSYFVPSENQPILLQWLEENATISLFAPEILRPLHETNLNFNTNNFE